MNSGRAVGDLYKPQRPPETGCRPLSRQVVTLAFLSEQLPSPLISRHLVRTLVAETGSSVILVRFEPQTDSAADPSRPDLYLNGEFHLPAQLTPTDDGFCFLPLVVRADPPSPAGLDSLVQKLSRLFRYVLIETAISKPAAPWIFQLLE